MTDPPTPTLTASFLSAIAALTWTFVKNDPTSTGLGVLKNGSTTHHLGATHGGTDATWAQATTLPSGFGSLLLSRDTAAILQNGTLQTDGRILNGGSHYRIASYFDGVDWTARAVAA